MQSRCSGTDELLCNKNLNFLKEERTVAAYLTKDTKKGTRNLYEQSNPK